MLDSAPYEVVIFHSGAQPFKCVAETTLPALIEAESYSTSVFAEQVSAQRLMDNLSDIMYGYDNTPSVVILVYSQAEYDAMEEFLASWPYRGQYVYRWDRGSDSIELVFYRPISWSRHSP